MKTVKVVRQSHYIIYEVLVPETETEIADATKALEEVRIRMMDDWSGELHAREWGLATALSIANHTCCVCPDKYAECLN